MFILKNICDTDGIAAVFSIIKTGLAIMRIIVPIGLIVMTGIDIFKKVINPDDKDGQRKILMRVIAGILVFFAPVMVDFVIRIATIGGANVESPCLNAWKGASEQWF